MSRAIERAEDPEIVILRVAPEGQEPRWYVDLRTVDGSRKVLVADKRNLITMAAIVPVYLVDLIEAIRTDLGEVFALPGFERGVEMVMPFEQLYRRGKPS